MPESILGYDCVRKEYSADSSDSAEKIAEHIRNVYPIATEKQIKKLVGKR